jgi:DNA transposition AAA+ family ATPase
MSKETNDGAVVVQAVAGEVQARASWPFGGDHVMAATKELPERQRDLVRWMFFRSIEEGVSLKDAADAIHYSNTVLWRVMKGEYEGDVSAVCDAIESYKRICDQRDGIARQAFVETDTAKRIWKICDAATTYQSIAMIFGDSQTGKTTALKEYARRHNHGATKYIRMPAAAGVQMVMRAFADACGISHKCNYEAMRERVQDAIDENTLVIVDELHQAFNTYQKHARVAVLEVIREIHDNSNCGMVLCGTNVAREEIERGQHKLLLEQLRRRGIFRLQLPQVAPWSDRVAIAAAYGLSDPEGAARETVDEIVHASGLRAYVSYLQAATKVASKRKQPLAWRHVQDAYDTVKKYSKFE